MTRTCDFFSSLTLLNVVPTVLEVMEMPNKQSINLVSEVAIKPFNLGQLHRTSMSPKLHWERKCIKKAPPDTLLFSCPLDSPKIRCVNKLRNNAIGKSVARKLKIGVPVKSYFKTYYTFAPIKCNLLAQIFNQQSIELA